MFEWARTTRCAPLAARDFDSAVGRGDVLRRLCRRKEENPLMLGDRSLRRLREEGNDEKVRRGRRGPSERANIALAM